MSSVWGRCIRLSLFGESHGPAVGVVIDGLAAGVPVDMEFMARQLQKRRGLPQLSTARREQDKAAVLSGVKGGFTTGAPVTIEIENGDTRPGDYKDRFLLRPGHADFAAFERYRGFQDTLGGGHFSGRLTAPLVAAGSIFLSILSRSGVKIATRIARIGQVCDIEADLENASVLEDIAFPVFSNRQGELMQQEILSAKSRGNSIGGVLETFITGLPAGVGQPFFDSVESVLGALLFSIPGVKGVEFGDGFALGAMTGEQASDPLCVENGRIKTMSNHNGGINGGLTNGMPIIVRAAIKPTPSMAIKQQTVDYKDKAPQEISVSGRHDPCIASRAAVVQSSLCAMGILDLCTRRWGEGWQRSGIWSTD